MTQPPVAFKRRFRCTDAVGREAEVVVELRDGELVVAGPPPGGFSFGLDQVAEAEGFQRTFAAGLEQLRVRRQEKALQLGMEMLSRGERPRRKGKRRGPRL